MLVFCKNQTKHKKSSSNTVPKQTLHRSSSISSFIIISSSSFTAHRWEYYYCYVLQCWLEDEKWHGTGQGPFIRSLPAEGDSRCRTMSSGCTKNSLKFTLNFMTGALLPRMIYSNFLCIRIRHEMTDDLGSSSGCSAMHSCWLELWN